MKHTAIDPKTGQALLVNDSTRDFQHQYLPRVRCLDCPGRLYQTGPGTDAAGFEPHLKFKKHRENVDARIESEKS